MRVRTAALILTLALGFLTVPLPAEAQKAGKVYRIGFLAWNPQSFYEDKGYLKAFWERLRGLGWIEDQNLIVEYRFVEGKADRLPGLVAELASLKLELIVTVNTTVTRAATKVIKTTPVVFTVVANPVDSGFVASLPRPGGNATGPSMMAPELAGKQLELLREAVPGISRVAVLWEPTNPGVALIFQQLRLAAQKLGVPLQSVEVREPKDFELAFSAVTREHADALIALAAPLTFRSSSQIVEFALRNQLPTMASWEGFPRDGGLMSYAANVSDHFRRAAPYVDRILRGAKPADLPVEQPTNFELWINLKTAKTLGLTIPPSLLIRADKVIE